MSLAERGWARQTLDKPGAVLRQVFYEHIPPAISQKPIQGRVVFVLRNSIPNLHNPAITTSRQLQLIATDVLQEEPRSRYQGSVNVEAKRNACIPNMVDGNSYNNNRVHRAGYFNDRITKLKTRHGPGNSSAGNQASRRAIRRTILPVPRRQQRELP
jgi:hypothetical protein